MSIYVDIEKRLGNFRLQVNLEAGDETLALLGASGCGKSMTLKCIAGIERPDRGRIVVDGVTLFDSDRGIDLKPQQRQVGLMFQNYALFPNMTVEQNIRAGAKGEPDSKRREAAVSEMMERFELTPLRRHYPHQLSGGQQQRVALARILVSKPRILLLDEPFSALDSHLRFRMEQEVRQVLRGFGKSVVLVSHDRDEVFRMADRIAVMDRGSVQVCGAKKDVFAHPGTRAAAVLTGCKNISRWEPLDDTRGYAADWGMELTVPGGARRATHIGIRMHDVSAESADNRTRCRVVDVIENPFSCTVLLQPVERPDSTPVGWETEKAVWDRLKARQLEIGFPMNQLLLLEEKTP